MGKVKLFKRRWLMLVIFSLNSTMSACLFISIAAVNNIISEYYDVQPHYIDWLSNTYFLLYTLLAIPAAFLMSYFGLRPILILSACFNAVSCAFRYSGVYRGGFIYVLVGQVIAALGYCTILQVPARISSTWFGEHERAIATSIGAFMNIFGVSLGFVMTTQIIEENTDMVAVGDEVKTCFLIQLIMACVFLLMTCFMYQEKPPTPPSLDMSIEQVEDMGEFVKSLKQLALNKNFNFMSQSYAIYFSIFNSFSIILNELVTTYHPTGYETSIGWMGFAATLISIPSAFMVGLMLDRYQNYRMAAITLNTCSMIVILAFTIVLTHSNSFSGVFICYTLFGIVGIPYFGGGLEQAAVITHPITESTSSAVILTIGNLYAFILVMLLGKFTGDGQISLVGYTMVGLYIISILLSILAKTESTKTLYPNVSYRQDLTMESNVDNSEEDEEIDDEKSQLIAQYSRSNDNISRDVEIDENCNEDIESIDAGNGIEDDTNNVDSFKSTASNNERP